MNIRILTFIVGLLCLVISCKDEIPCEPTCTPLQECIEGVCTCPDDFYNVNEWCVESRDGYFFGNLDCGCLDEFIVNLPVADGKSLIILYGRGSTSTTFKLQTDSLYKATLISQSCNFDGLFSQNIDFTIYKVSETELKVETRWWNIVDGTLAECEGTFIH